MLRKRGWVSVETVAFVFFPSLCSLVFLGPHVTCARCKLNINRLTHLLYHCAIAQIDYIDWSRTAPTLSKDLLSFDWNISPTSSSLSVFITLAWRLGADYIHGEYGCPLFSICLYLFVCPENLAAHNTDRQQPPAAWRLAVETLVVHTTVCTGKAACVVWVVYFIYFFAGVGEGGKGRVPVLWGDCLRLSQWTSSSHFNRETTAMVRSSGENCIV